MNKRLPNIVVFLIALVMGGSPVRSATILWTNTASGGWNTAANWNPNTVPGAADVAVIGITNAGVVVSLNGATTAGGVVIGTNAGGPVTLSLNNQTLALNGPLTVNSSGSFTVDGGALVGNTNAVLNGTIGWTAASLGGVLTLASGSVLNITTGNDHQMPSCAFTNNGTVTWSAGRVRGGSTPGTVIVNNGLWNSQGDLTINNDYGGTGTVFNNAGTFRKSAGSGGSTLFTGGVLLNNTGKLDVQTNFLVLQGSGSFTGGTATNLLGVIVLSSGAFNINGTVSSTNMQLNGGTLTGVNVLNGGLNWIAGTWNGASPVTIPSGSVLLVTSGNDHDLPNVTLTNNGTVAWLAGRIRGGSTPGTVIYNNGLWDSQGDLTFNDDLGGTGTVFNNAGTFRKSASTGGSTVLAGGVLFNNTGKLDVLTNSVYLQGSGNFTSGTATNLQGTIVLSAGTFNINGTVISTNMQLNGGALTGTNVFNGGFNWVAGDWSTATNITVPAGSTLFVTSGADHNMPNVMLANNGTVAWLTGRIRGGSTPGTVINNHGLWDSQGDLTLNNDYGGNGTVFNNYNIFRKSAGTNTSSLIASGVVFNQLSGAVDVQTGDLVLQGGGNFTGGTATNNNGNLVFSAGSFNLNGTLTGTNVIENAGNLVGANVVNGTLQWQAGSWQFASSVTIPNGSTVRLAPGSGANMFVYSCVVTNYGTFVWNSGHLDGGSTPGTIIYNYGLWDCQGDYNLKADGGGSGMVFNNYATFRKSAGTNISQTLIQGGVLFNQISGAVEVQRGNLVLQGGGNFTGGSVPNNNGILVFSLGSFNLNGTLTGTNVFENSGNLVGNNVVQGWLTWSGGAWSGANVTITTNSTVLLAPGGGANMFFYNCLVTNYGTFAWNSGHPDGGSSSGTVVYNFGLWDCQSDYNFRSDGGGAGVMFNNYGTFRKSAGTNISQTLVQGGVLFNQLNGAVDVQQGNLVLQGGGNFAGGYVTTNQTGLTILSVGSFNLNGSVTTTNTIENTGNLVGTNVIRGGLTWAGGAWSSANVTIASNSTVMVAPGGAPNMFLYSCTLTNYGTFAWNSGHLDGGSLPGTAIYNYGLWDCQSDFTFRNDGGGSGTLINNYGTFRKSAGSDANQTTLAGGVFINNFGKLDSQAGWLVLQGGYNLTNGTVNLGINSLTNGGKISLPGAAALTGTISANLNNGYIPIKGNSFTNLYYGSFTGQFTNSILPSADAWQTNYFPTYFVMTVLNSRPVFAALPTNTFVINELTAINVTNTAADGDLPPQALTYALAAGVPGMTVNPANGILTWIPPQTNSPSTNIVSVAVTDNGTPVLSATNTFTVIVNEINVPPTLPTIATQVVSELTLLTVTNAATNFNIHSTIVGYSLVNPLAGMSISASGVITWTPTQFQSPGTNVITTIVTNSNPYDLVNPRLTSTNAFSVVTREVNVPPSPPTLPTQIVNELALLTATNSATNANIHSTILGYALVSPLAGMNINASGIFTWTPTQAQSPGTNLVTAIVTNSNPYDLVNPKLTATNTFTVIVKEVNQPPTLPVIGTQTLTLLQSFAITNSAGETNIHSATAGYLLVSPPAGVSISASGVISWTPAASQSLTTNTITTIVTNTNPYDLVNPHLSATNSFKAIVLPNMGRTNLISVSLGRTNLDLSWPADHTGWRIQNQTNTLAKGLGTNWATVAGSSATNHMIIPVTRTNGVVIFRMVYP